MLLTKDDAAEFFRLMWGLQFYVNQQQHIMPNVSSCAMYARLDRKEKIVVRDALWKQPNLIDNYLQENPDKLTAEEQAIVRDWKNFVAGKFYIVRYLKNHAIFIKGKQVYGVKGLYDHFDEMFGGHPLPIFVDAVLLPYKGQIIYDGVCYVSNVYFGKGIRSSLNEAYLAAKQNGRIQLTLENAAQAPNVRDKAQTLAPGSAKIAAEIVWQSKKLRQGTAIQKAAFGILRDSAMLAETAVAQAEDIGTLRRLRRKLSNALSRLEKALERAES